MAASSGILECQRPRRNNSLRKLLVIARETYTRWLAAQFSPTTSDATADCFDNSILSSSKIGNSMDCVTKVSIGQKEHEEHAAYASLFYKSLERLFLSPDTGKIFVFFTTIMIDHMVYSDTKSRICASIHLLPSRSGSCQIGYDFSVAFTSIRRMKSMLGSNMMMNLGLISDST